MAPFRKPTMDEGVLGKISRNQGEAWGRIQSPEANHQLGLIRNTMAELNSPKTPPNPSQEKPYLTSCPACCRREFRSCSCASRTRTRFPLSRRRSSRAFRHAKGPPTRSPCRRKGVTQRSSKRGALRLQNEQCKFSAHFPLSLRGVYG